MRSSLADDVVGVAIDRIDHVLERICRSAAGVEILDGRREQRLRVTLTALSERRRPVTSSLSVKAKWRKPISSVMPVEIADEVGEDAVEAVAADIELLMLVAGDEEVSRCGGQGEIGVQEAAGARVGQVEVKPKPAVGLVLDRLVDGELLRRAVGGEAKGGDQSRQSLSARIGCCALGQSLLHAESYRTPAVPLEASGPVTIGRRPSRLSKRQIYDI